MDGILPVIDRQAGLQDGGPAVGAPPMHEADQENLAFLNGIHVEAEGDPAEHLFRHARFAETSLGRALPGFARKALLEHMSEHVAQCLGGRAVDVDDMHAAGKLASMKMDYEKGAGSEG